MATNQQDDLPFTIDQVVRILGLPIYRDRGSSWQINCPFCYGKNGQEDTHGHMYVSHIKQGFKCHRCGRSGGKLDLYAMYKHTDTQTAYRQIWEALYGPRDALHRGKRKGKVNLPPPSIKPVEVAPSPETTATLAPEVLDNTFRHLLRQLTLTDFHRRKLHNRGLSDAEIDRLEYRSVPAVGLRRIAMNLQKEGCVLEGVPGFYVDEEGAWKLNVFTSGIIMPARDHLHRITGLQVRKDRYVKGKCYWITSGDLLRGCRNINRMHFTSSNSLPADGTVHLTEGTMKADITAVYSDWFMLSVAGVSQFSSIRAAILPLQNMRVRRVVFDYDMDMYTNPAVLEALQTSCQIFMEAGFEVLVDQWDREQKGIDDLWVWSASCGKTPQIETLPFGEIQKRFSQNDKGE